MNTAIGNILKPFKNMSAYAAFCFKAITIQAVIFDILDSSFNLTFTFRISGCTGMNSKTCLCGILIEFLSGVRLGFCLY